MKRKMLLIAALVISFAVMMTPSALCCGGPPRCCEEVPPVLIEKEAYCMKPSSGPIDTYSNNPPFYMGKKYYWWIEINVTAKTDLTDYHVVVYDRLGAEFMIEGICVNSPKQPDLPGYPNMGGNPKPFDYTFDYSAGNPWPESHEDIVILDKNNNAVTTGYVDWRGVEFQGIVSGDEDTFRVFWTGKSCKAHFEWFIGPMGENKSKIIYLVISTDKNPGGHQEFTSPCTHYLNSGATVKVLRHKRCSWRPFYSATTAPITIKVEGN